jgi:deoxyribose-phosphate aldolase
MANIEYKGLGRRKKSIAKVIITPGTGNISINGKKPQEYFPNALVIQDMEQPLVLTDSKNKFDVRVKVIIEINALTGEETDRACEIIPDTGAEFIKTGTGWISGPANIPRVKRVKELTRGKIKVKAAGGIRTREEFEELAAAGIERFGINLQTALEIVSSYG